MRVTTTGGSDTAGTLASPIALELPGAGTLKTSDDTMVAVSVTSDLKTRPVTITAGKGTFLLNEAPDATNKYNAKSGSQSLSLTSTSTGSVEFWAYTTTTAKTKITIAYAAAAGKEDSDAKEFYVQGTADADLAWNLSVDAVKAVALGKVGTVTATVTDVFGNDITDLAAGKATLTVAGAGSANSGGAFAYDSVTEKIKATFTATSGNAGKQKATKTVTVK
jgi:hypothetical protein